MKTIYFLTNIAEKFNDAKFILSRHGIAAVRADDDLTEKRSHEIREVAAEKARQAFAQVKRPVIAEDSGLFIRILNGFPGAFHADVIKAIGIDGILKLMDGKEDRAAELRSALAYFDGKNLSIFDFTIKGKIAGEIQLAKNFGFGGIESIFIPEYHSKAIGQMPKKEFDEYRNELLERSHFKKLGEWLGMKQ